MIHSEEGNNSQNGIGDSSQLDDAKVLKDLSILSEQINLCRNMLHPGDNCKVDIDTNDTLKAVIGFLEACVPRMLQLIQDGMQGAIAEETMVKCLEVNDALTITLECLDNPRPLSSSTQPEVVSSANQGKMKCPDEDCINDDKESQCQDDFDDFFGERINTIT